jgi:hypothetical protein
MPFNISRTEQLFAKEILRSAAGLDDIKSMVLDATKVDEYPVGSGRYVLEAGHVMARITGSDKVQPIAHNAGGGTGGAGAFQAADIVGVLGNTIEVMKGDAAIDGKSDAPVPVLHHECNFDVSQLVGYTGIETAVKTALPTCLFTTPPSGYATRFDK